MKNILITGFDPFHGESINPSPDFCRIVLFSTTIDNITQHSLQQ